MRNTVIMLIAGILFLSSFTIFMHIETCIASGNTIYVDNDYDGSTPGWQIDHFDKIKDGVNAANINDTVDTVYVYSGEYHEYEIVITSDLTLTGENKDTTIIDVDKNGHVIEAYGSAGNEITFSISGFTIKNAGGEGNDCIAMSYVNDGDINDNVITSSDSGDGIQLDHCSGITISNNAITNNNVNGIHFILSTDNTVENNQIQNNQRGIRIYLSSNNNMICDNTITANTQYGIRILQSQNNRIYLNEFTNNGQNAYDSSSNDWNYISQGNHWDDYTGTDSDNDGIGDTPYDIPGGSNQDLYPLVNQKPVATIDSITPNPATQGQTVSFSGHGEDSDGDVTGYNWRSSKDGQLSTQSSFSTSSLSVGTHTIYFKVKDDDNEWSDEISTSLVINSQDDQKPTAVIVNPDPSTTTTATQGESVAFHGYGIPSEGIIIEKSWRSSRDGVISSEYTFTKSDLSVGTHTIYFKVKDSNGWSDEVSTNLVINSQDGQKPVATIDSITPNPATQGQTVSFSGHGEDSDGDVTGYNWRSSKDGQLSTQSSFSTSSLSVGTHTIYFKVKDDDNEWSDEISTSLVINTDSSPNRPPSADPGGPYSGYVNASISFDGSKSYDPDGEGDIVLYEWDFGDGTNGTGILVEHLYSTTGSYIVNLTITDSYGNKATNSTYANVIESTDQNGETPGFEILFIIIAVAFILVWKKNIKDKS